MSPSRFDCSLTLTLSPTSIRYLVPRSLTHSLSSLCPMSPSRSLTRALTLSVPQVDGSLKEGMGEEHNKRGDSQTPFLRSMSKPDNPKYATPAEEWTIVVEPEEGRKYSSGRKGTPLKVFEALMAVRNNELRESKHAQMIVEELVGARLYTGPMFEKYNLVLRFFTGKPKYTAEELEGKGKDGLPFKGKDGLPFLLKQCETFHIGKWVADGCGSLEWQWTNKYPTTIHAINSCILTLSKLSKAGHVFRGLTGATLPESFFVKDKMGLRGGIEYGFTSTTPDRDVATGYAKGKASTVFEASMGMIDRGADISWLSQFAHEQEVLFPPLMALEVMGTRVDGDILIVTSKLSLNMMSLTLMQLVARRRTIVASMAEQMQLQAAFKLEGAGSEWDEVRALEGGAAAVKAFLAGFEGVAAQEPTYYNVDEQLGGAVLDAVALSKILESWPTGLRELAQREEKASVAELVEGADGIFRLAKEGDVTDAQAHGIIAVVWVRQRQLGTIDLSERKCSPEAVAALARSLPLSVTSLDLRTCDVANGGNAIKGVEQLGLALRNPQCKVAELNLDGNDLREGAGRAIGDALAANMSLMSLRCAPASLPRACCQHR